MSRYWLGVASQDHVANAVQGGFCQFNHGKQAPLKRLSADDWIIYYSPKYSMTSSAPLQAFTAVGRVLNDDIQQWQQTETFKPFRKEIDYLQALPAAIRPLLGELSFIEDPKSWGLVFRRGFFEITGTDFKLIVQAMGLCLPD